MIVAFWHNRLAMMPYCWPSRHPFHMLISAHPDGRLIAKTVRHFGIDAVAGSSRRGGREALRGLVRLAEGDGASVGITPDGPRGPRMRAGDGALTLARLSGAAILPAAVSVSRRIVLNTWDRLIIALPFSRGAMVWGDPIVVPRDADDATLAALAPALGTGTQPRHRGGRSHGGPCRHGLRRPGDPRERRMRAAWSSGAPTTASRGCWSRSARSWAVITARRMARAKPLRASACP